MIDVDQVWTDRFWSRVTKTEGCWEWTGGRTNGYGKLRWGPGWDLAHRISYELNVGPIPEGLTIDHLCRNRACVNPEHLEPVTRGENTRRGLLGYGFRTECRNGHDLTGDDAIDESVPGRRTCRRCLDERAAERNALRRNPRPNHCPSGHEFTPENTRRSKEGHRRCRECARISGRQRSADQRGAHR